MRKRIKMFLVFGGGAGLLPNAPGTYGSMLGVLSAYLLNVLCEGDFCYLLLSMVLLFLCAWYLVWSTQEYFVVHDDPRIVIDEIVGQALVVCWFDPAVWLYIYGFCLFRLFDISKAFLVGVVERKFKNSFGIMADDVVAAVFSLIVVTTTYYTIY